MKGNKALFAAAFALLACGLVEAACSRKPPPGPPLAQPGLHQPQPRRDYGRIAESLDDPGIPGIMEGRTSGPMVPVYFAFDSSLIEGEQIGRMETNAGFLRGNPGVRIRVEGNCDPRGTREYNLALGERRAQSGARHLMSLGVEPGRMRAISFGEEKLLFPGSDEDSHARNRRDDFVIVGR